MIVRFFTAIEYLIGASFFSAIGFGAGNNEFGAFVGFLFGLIVVYSYCQILKYVQLRANIEIAKHEKNQ